MALTNKEIRRRYYLRHIVEIKAKSREHYLKYGRKRGEMTEDEKRRNTERTKQWQRANPEKYEELKKRHRGSQREKALVLKREVLTYYGGGRLECVICSEGRLACLSIDHIHGGGTKHRKQLRAWGGLFNRWLKGGGYPNGYQTLCMNCQFVKRSDNREV